MTTFILIPHYAQRALQRNGLPLAKFLDFNTLRTVLSINDIVLALSLQREWQTLCGASSRSGVSFSQYDSSYELEQLWYKSSTPEDRIFLSEVVRQLANESGQSNKELHERIFDAAAQSRDDQVPYKIQDLQSQLYGVVIYPGQFPGTKVQHKLIEDLLKALYVYGDHHEVAETPFFRKYLEGLQAQTLLNK